MDSKCTLSAMCEQMNAIRANRPLFFLFIAAALYAALKLARVVRAVVALYHTLTATSNLKKYYRPGSWAVITGATDGIGLALTKELYQLNWNLLLIGRNQDKLEMLIKNNFSSKPNLVKPFILDFSKATDSDYSNLSEMIKDKDIGLLINNVGMSYECPEFFDHIPEGQLTDIVNVNILSALRMTYVILPQMLFQKRGLVVNISSAATMLPDGWPLVSTYAATKAFLNSWSKSLNQEYKNKNIFFEAVVPCYVSTKMSKVKSTNVFVPSSETYAKSVVRKLGSSQQHSGYFWHDLQCYIMQYAPAQLMNKYIFRKMLTIRKKYLAKMNKNK